MVGEDTRYPEIPTIPTNLEEITQKIMELPLNDLFNEIFATVDALKIFAENPELGEVVHNLNLGLGETRELIKNIHAKVDPLSTSLNGAISNYSNLATSINKIVEPIGMDIEEGLNSATSAINSAEDLIKELQTVLTGDSGLNIKAGSLLTDMSAATKELKRSLKEISAAGRSVRVLADYLERHPEALLTGKD
jgi:paraquat-inducible protein B